MGRKFEKLIECIVNNDNAGAKKLFHAIVVDKSRKIYESMEALYDDVNKAKDLPDECKECGKACKGAKCKKCKGIKESFYNEDEDMEHVDDDMSMDHDNDSADFEDHDMESDNDMESDDDMDFDMSDESSSEMGSDNIESRVDDMESAIDKLKAEFAELMDKDDEDMEDMEDHEESAEEDLDDAKDEMHDADEDVDDEDEDVDDADEDDDDDNDEEMIREYEEKIGDAYKSGKGVSTDKEETFVNKKSVVAGKNDMGGTSKNVAQGARSAGEKGRPTPKSGDFSSEKFRNAKGGSKNVMPSPATKPIDKEDSTTNKKSVFESNRRKK